MDITTLITLVTMAVTFVFGLIAKKVSWFNNNLIPLQDIAIGLIVALIEYIITKDFSTSIALAGVTAGGAYDIIHNITKLKIKKEEE